MVMAPLISAVTAAAPAALAGTAAGVVTTAMQAGNALGVAVIGLVFYTTLGTAHTPTAYSSGYLAGTGYLLALALAVAALTARLTSTDNRKEQTS